MLSENGNRLSQIFSYVRNAPIWDEYTKWQIFVFLFGALAIIYLMLNIFTSLTNKTPPPFTEVKVSTNDMDSFEASLAGSISSPVEKGSPVRILVDGSEFMDDLLLEIKNANQSINITNYIWEDGQFGNTLLRALIDKANEGVKVRLLLDGIGGRKADKKYIADLKKAGGEVAYFRPVTWWNITRINRRNHVREFVIDGRIAYMGGVAIADNWLGDGTSKKFWHDFMFKVSGIMAEKSGQIFSNMWSQTTGEIFANSKRDAYVGESSAPQNNIRFISLFSTPAPDMSANMEHFIWLSIKASQNSVHIENPYLVPSQALLKVLKEKAKSGVDVKIIVPGKNTDTKIVQWASQSYYYELLDAGVKIYEYEPTRIHSKIMIIDGKWSVVGSANLDNRSSQLNLEAIMGVEDSVLAQNLEDQFQKDLKKSAEITNDHWKRKIILRPFGLLSRLFVHQF